MVDCAATGPAAASSQPTARIDSSRQRGIVSHTPLDVRGVVVIEHCVALKFIASAPKASSVGRSVVIGQEYDTFVSPAVSIHRFEDIELRLGPYGPTSRISEAVANSNSFRSPSQLCGAFRLEVNCATNFG
jgi:hypothetical protein